MINWDEWLMDYMKILAVVMGTLLSITVGWALVKTVIFGGICS